MSGGVESRHATRQGIPPWAGVGAGHQRIAGVAPGPLKNSGNTHMNFDEMDRKFSAARNLALAAYLFAFAFWLAVLSGLAYVAWHFISKHW